VQGYVVVMGRRLDVVIDEGIDPFTGRERRRWHPARLDRAIAEDLAAVTGPRW